jgi:methylase of polypeptide subunit release factors
VKALEQGNPKVETLYEEWERVFGIVYSEDPKQLSDKKAGLGKVYDADDDVEVTKFLFAVQTYYAFFSKLLVLDLFAMFETTIVQTQDLLVNNDDKLRRRLERVESGDEFDLAGFPNFYEENQFIWYLSAWNDDVATCFRQMASTMEDFEPATSTIRPELVRDLLKRLYEDLVPKGIRHNLGEYLTPDWLAEHTVRQAGYEGDGRVLDPGCGSGTFLVTCISRIKRHSESEGRELLEEVAEKVVGFDLNPLSVMAARANYLIALGDDVYKARKMTIPVYQCDSILIPNKKPGPSGRENYTVETGQGNFWIPEIGGRDKIENLLELVHTCVEAEYSAEEFWVQYEQNIETQENHEYEVKELYRKIRELDIKGRDRIWTRLLRNSLAPVFEGKFDYVIGNPPWINWENISEEYREATRQLWRQYEIYTTEGDYGARRLGGSKTDAAMIFTYVSADKYLKDGGTLSFLIPETHFKAQAARGFRRFQLGDGECLGVLSAEDLSEFNPFDASNRTGIIRLEKGTRTDYPVEYIEWTKNWGESIDESLSLEEVERRVSKRTLAASPINDTDDQSAWLPARSDVLEPIKEVLGESNYKAVAGSYNEGLNGLFCLSIVEQRENGNVLIRNRPDTGRKDVEEIQDELEIDHIYPHLQGKDVPESFSIEHRLYTFMFEDGNGNTISEDQMKNRQPKTYSYLRKFEELLLSRSSYQLNYNDDDPFYDMHGATPHTVAPHKVVWREQKTPFTSAVVGNRDDEHVGNKPLIPSHKLMVVPLQNKDEAHYLCALLNTSVVRLVVDGYAVDVQIGTHITKNVYIPDFDPENETHQALAEQSKMAHKDSNKESYRAEIDRLSGEVWDISEYMDAIRSAAAEI